MADLNTDVRYIKGIGEAKAKSLGKLGIATLGDLINWFPRRYEDRREIKPISQLIPGEPACVSAMIASEPKLSHIRKGMDLVKVRAVDDTGALDVAFFNQSWLKNQLRVGETYTFYGRAEGSLLRKSMASPIVEPEGRREHTGRIVPIYPLTAGISQLLLSRAIRQGLDSCADILPDCLPDGVRQAHQLCRVNYAYENIHFPESPEALDIARRRLAFEELFFFAIGLKLLRSRRETVSVEPFQPVDMAPFYNALPFTLTDAQRRCVEEAIADMQSGKPMNRLCQGDVGSGKTMVAAACVYFCIKNGRQAALMAPTELLAEQHYRGLAPLLERLNIRCALLTGSTTVKTKRSVTTQLATGEIDFVIGTHALISGGVAYADLGLVVTDEQHRFGVAQRTALAEKGEHPHTLVMSATPIPRTLALILYGDLDVSVIDQLPPGRKPIETYAVTSAYHPRLYAFIRKQVEAGRQVYIVYPLIKESEKIDLKNLEEGYQHILEEFPECTVCKVHGKMKAAEKDEQMQLFISGKAQIMVATTVIEVGVNVPNASVMIIENAERFGLSQLHQLRGRVGRGADQSYCILVTNYKLTEDTRKRLEIMVRTNDGFEIAEADLKLRGPGDLEGTQQSGVAFDLKIADIARDGQLLQYVRAIAEDIVEHDPGAQSPENEILWRQLKSLRKTNVNWAAIS